MKKTVQVSLVCFVVISSTASRVSYFGNDFLDLTWIFLDAHTVFPHSAGDQPQRLDGSVPEVGINGLVVECSEQNDT